MDGQLNCESNDILNLDDIFPDHLLWDLCQGTDHNGAINSQAGPSAFPGESSNILDFDDPLSDPDIWAFCNGTDDDGAGNSQAVPNVFPGESSNGSGNSVSRDHGIPLSVFSVPWSEYKCTFCQRLREITHTNGMNVKRLELNGRIGTITHAVLNNCGADSSFQSQELKMFDFSRESIETVKQFLFEYLEACKQEGYNMLRDPLSTFYEALCAGLSEPNNPGCCPNNGQEMRKQPEDGSNEVGFMKIPLAEQTARTGKIKLTDLIEYIGLPIHVAARKLNTCPTALKKICRKHDLLRWPYRKIESIKRKISSKRERLNASDNMEKAQLIADIQKHQQELADIYEAFKR